MSRARSLLRPDENILFRNDPGPVWLGLPLAAVCLAVLGLMGHAIHRGDLRAEDWRGTLALLPLTALFFFWYAHRPEIIVTESRILRSAGLLRLWVESVAREDIAEIRFRGWWTGILARAPGLLRRTEPNGMAIADRRIWFTVGGLGWWRRRKDAGRTERQAFAAAVGLKPLLWRPPSLPEEAARLAAVDSLAWMGMAVLWMVGAWLAPSLWEVWVNGATPLTEHDFWVFWPAMLLALWVMKRFRRYAILLLAPWLSGADMVELWLCTRFRPDWRGEHPETVSASRARRQKLYERIMSERYGRPVRCDRLPGPEMLNGGWIKST